jgi:VWFA-related protein
MVRTRLLAIAVLPITLVAVGAEVTAQFRSRTDLVEVAAIATGSDGRPVIGLTALDFEVEEDRASMAISTFIAIDSDLASKPAEGRMLVLLLDDVHPVLTARIKQIARMFAQRMSGHDVVAVLPLNGGNNSTTTRKDAVLRQIDTFKPYTPGMLPAKVGSICPDCAAGTDMGPHGGQAARSSGHALAMISNLSTQLSRVPHRRKTIVCIGDPALYATGDRASTSVRAASLADVSVDIIDAGGLKAFDPGASGVGSAEIHDGSMVLANETGGRAFLDTNFFEQAVDKVWQDAGHYYLLGYVAPSGPRGPHVIAVHVKRTGVEVRARKSRT